MSSPISPTSDAVVKKIQCPHCGSVHRAKRSGFHYTDYFDCPSCGEGFSWTWGESDVQAESLAMTEALRACPKCDHPFASKADLCPRCGAYRSKVDSQDLEKIWEGLMAMPLERDAHEKFIRLCHQRGRLFYAKKKYETLLDLTHLEFFQGLLELVRELERRHFEKPKEFNILRYLNKKELKSLFFGIVRQAVLFWRSLDRVHK